MRIDLGRVQLSVLVIKDGIISKPTNPTSHMCVVDSYLTFSSPPLPTLPIFPAYHFPVFLLCSLWLLFLFICLCTHPDKWKSLAIFKIKQILFSLVCAPLVEKNKVIQIDNWWEAVLFIYIASFILSLVIYHHVLLLLFFFLVSVNSI